MTSTQFALFIAMLFISNIVVYKIAYKTGRKDLLDEIKAMAGKMKYEKE